MRSELTMLLSPYRAEAGPSLAPPATSKARYLRDRFNVIKQVILRNEHFSPPTLVGQERQDYMKVCGPSQAYPRAFANFPLSRQQLTSIKNLLGRQGGHFLIFGLLTRMEDGALYLEDLDDKVELDLSEAVSALSLQFHSSAADPCLRRRPSPVFSPKAPSSSLMETTPSTPSSR